MNTLWKHVMGGLVGRRLALYEEVAFGRKPDTRDLEIQDALGWCIYHRFIERDGERYNALPIAEAKARWENEGPASAAAADVGREPQPHSPDPESPTRASAEAETSSAAAASHPAAAEISHDTGGERLSLEATPRSMKRAPLPPKKDEEEVEPRRPDHPNQTTFL